MLSLLALASVVLVLPAEPPVEYVVRLGDARSQVVHVSMVVRGVEANQLDVALPVWRPGRYEVINPAGSVRTLSAHDGEGRVLRADKIASSTWRIALPDRGAGGVTVDYDLYANSLGDRTRHADSTHAFLSPATVFLFRPGLTGPEGGPLRIRIDAPEGWGVATGLSPEADDPRVLTAPSYDVLADSPIEIGEQERVTFGVGGVPHEIVVWHPGGPPGYPLAEWPESFTKIIREQESIFGRFPYTRYVFLVHDYPGGGGGTEHVNSTVIQTSPGRLADAEAFRGFLGLVSHEFFHTWNVKQFRPSGIKPYDYLHENYTRLLWVAEGTTSYYSPLTLVRAGITRPDDYLRALGSGIDALRSRPGAAVQSLEESSFDAWIKFSKRSPDSENTTVSFYDKGALVSLALDMQVRKRSGGRRSLDDVMRALFERFPLGGPAYTTDDVLAALHAAAGSGFEDFFGAHVAGTEPVDFESALAVVGLRLVRGTGKDDPDRPYLGLNVTDSGGLASVSGVASDGPAFSAGLIAGDLVVALNGQRVTAAGLDAMTRRLQPGDTARVQFFRYDVLHDVAVTVGGKPAGRWTVSRVDNPTPEQLAAYTSWLHREWPGHEPKEETR
ncbi:MAG: M61 family metallopeptidase [Phycisphaerales bacterium]|nr:M61 family metallopeptidase [Phycisphaerales bacterium]